MAATVSWYQIELPNDQVALGAGWSIFKTFLFRYLELSHPKGVALLDNCNPSVFDTPLDYYYYFTPAAVPLFEDLIRQYQGKPCPEPPPNHSTYLAGDEAFLSANRANAANAPKKKTD
jgi:hypothetical protein